MTTHVQQTIERLEADLGKQGPQAAGYDDGHADGMEYVLVKIREAHIRDLENVPLQTYRSWYTSEDGPGPDATWTVYREEYDNPRFDGEPLEDSIVPVASCATEHQAQAVVNAYWASR